MNNLYKTNTLTCNAVQLKNINDIESFNNEVLETMNINIEDYALSSTPKPLLVIQLEDSDLEEALFMNEGDYFVNIPLFKNPIIIHKEVFESVFEKVED